MIPFGFDEPPTSSSEPVIEVLTEDEFRRALDAAMWEGRTAPPPRASRKAALKEFLVEVAAAFAGEIAAAAVTAPVPMRLAIELAAGHVAGEVVGEPVRDVVRALFRAYGSEPERLDKIADLMAKGGVDPERIAADPDLAYRTFGPIEFWIDLLEITRQQAILAQARRGESLVDPLAGEIAAARAARDRMLAVRGMVPDNVPTDAERRGAAAIDAFRRRHGQ
jgi:hypothetical protein